MVNNAAVNFVGALEFCTMDMYKMIAEVNQFGVIRVTKAFLPQIRKSKGKFYLFCIASYIYMEGNLT